MCGVDVGRYSYRIRGSYGQRTTEPRRLYAWTEPVRPVTVSGEQRRATAGKRTCMTDKRQNFCILNRPSVPQDHRRSEKRPFCVALLHMLSCVSAQAQRHFMLCGEGLRNRLARFVAYVNKQITCPSRRFQWGHLYCKFLENCSLISVVLPWHPGIKQN